VAWLKALAIPMEQRFLAMVQCGSPSECWPWLGARSENGYGRFSSTRGRHHYAHRLVWELEFGPIAAGMVVCHRCDNPVCCNPAHLWLGTQAENLADMREKGRRPPLEKHGQAGERNNQARLTDANVRAIRALHRAGVSQVTLSRTFGVGQTTIGHVVHGRTWRHVT
jgi:hypothetical protein